MFIGFRIIVGCFVIGVLFVYFVGWLWYYVGYGLKLDEGGYCRFVVVVVFLVVWYF